MIRRSSIPLSSSLFVEWGYALTEPPHAGLWAPSGVGFVHHVGYSAHYDVGMGRSSWPIPPCDDCGELARFADAHGILSAERPETGDIFLVWSESARQFTRAGIVVMVGRAVRYPSGFEH